MEEVTDPNDWEYRAEGNLHVIVVNKATKQVLRLLKCSKDTICNESASLEATGNELSYVRYVAHPLMQNCKACFPMRKVLLNQDFLNAISNKVEDERPPLRLHKSIDTSQKCGILMPDFCQVLPPPPSKSDLCISVEIKPKQGFILSGQKQCKFSLSQRLKVQSKTYDRESRYCPVDLFSGSKKRMQRAIKSLISEPQNNLRIFKNGGVIYSQEVVEEKKERARDVFKSTVLPIFASHFHHQPNSDRLKQAYHSFKDLLCNLLLHPVCEQSTMRTHTPQLCDNSSDIPPKKKSSNENESKFLNTGSKCPSEVRLSPNCTLGLLLSLQKLENRSVIEYYKMYRLLQNHLDSFPDDASVLSLEGPYDAPHWQEIVDEIWKSGGTDYLRENESSWRNDVVKSASLLRKFLIATSFNDCSIIMTFQLKKQDENCTECELPMTIKTRHGQEYWASLALVDSDPKPASRIPEYYNLARSLQCDR